MVPNASSSETTSYRAPKSQLREQKTDPRSTPRATRLTLLQQPTPTVDAASSPRETPHQTFAPTTFATNTHSRKPEPSPSYDGPPLEGGTLVSYQGPYPPSRAKPNRPPRSENLHSAEQRELVVVPTVTRHPDLHLSQTGQPTSSPSPISKEKPFSLSRVARYYKSLAVMVILGTVLDHKRIL